MSSLFVQTGASQIEVVGAGKTTFDEKGINKGVIVPLVNGEDIVLFVNSHEEPGPADMRIELSEKVHREGQVFYGKLPEFGTVDFQSHDIGMISVVHQGQRK